MEKWFDLDVNDKVKLVELMIVVGGILGAFKVKGDLITWFVLFLLFSLIYLIGLKSKPNTKFCEKFSNVSSLTAFIMAIGFSATLSVVLVQEMSLDPLLKLIIALVYTAFSTIIFYSALNE